MIGEPVDLVVGDLSFISLTLVLDALIGVTAEGGDLVLMVKPQFEVGRSRVGKGGVVRDPALRAEAVTMVAEAAADRGWGARAVAVSPLPGPVGQRGVLPVAAAGTGGDRRGRDRDRGVDRLQRGSRVRRLTDVTEPATRAAARPPRSRAGPRRRAPARRGLSRHGIEVRLLADEAAALGLADNVDPPRARPRAADPSADCELVVVIGGDGTILRAAEVAHASGTPMLGVNLGHVGFLAEAEYDDVESTIDAIVEPPLHRRGPAHDRRLGVPRRRAGDAAPSP